MRLLLLNNNPAVSRLIKLSVDKVGYEMDEFDDYGLVPLKSYDVIMVDNELYDETELKALSEQVHCEYFLYICQRGSEKPSLVNVSLEKPFLPTDFLTLLDKVKNVVNSFKAEEQEPKEEYTSFESDNNGAMHAFDIDDIDTFGIEDDGKLDLLDVKDNDDEDTKSSFKEIEEDEMEDDEESPLSLDVEEEALDALETNDSLADFNFEDEEVNFEDKEETEETESFDEISTSVLDKDDINEVKQLLDDDDNDSMDSNTDADADVDEKEEEFDFSLDNSDTFMEDKEDTDLSCDKELATEEEDIEEELLLDETTLSNPLEDEDSSPIEELPLETQEDIIDDFAEEIEEKMEEEAEEKETLEPTVTLSMADMDALDVESLDDLNENLLKKAFGEEVEEREEEKTPQESVHEIEVMRGEIESSIARSISGFAQSDILREALKGMKINISITFDEKN